MLGTHLDFVRQRQQILGIPRDCARSIGAHIRWDEDIDGPEIEMSRVESPVGFLVSMYGLGVRAQRDVLTDLLNPRGFPSTIENQFGWLYVGCLADFLLDLRASLRVEVSSFLKLNQSAIVATFV